MKIRVRQLLRSARGAFDLPSILIGGIVVGILTAGVLVAVFGVIPGSQDGSAKQNLASIRTAEGVTLGKDGSFNDGSGLAAAQYLPRTTKADVSVNTAKTCYLGLSKSDSGKVFYSTDKANEPAELAPGTVIDGQVPGCLAKDATSTLVTNVGGYSDTLFKPVGSGTGADSPGYAVKAPALTSTSATTSPVRVNSLTVYGSSNVEVAFENTSSASYRMPYSINVACRNTTTGAVTAEQITGYFDVNSHVISSLALIACIPGTVPVDVSIPTYTSPEVYRWRTAYVYNYAEPVVRGVTASAAPGTTAWCIDNQSNTNAVGNPVNLAGCANTNSQRWEWSGNGVFRQSTLADKCLVADTHKLVLGTCSTAGNQSFKAEPFQGNPNGGLVQIRVQDTGECVDIPGGALAAVQLSTAPCSGTPSQSWYMPGLGLGGQTVTPAIAPPALTVTSLGNAYGTKIVNSGSDLVISMRVGSWSAGKVSASDVELTCLAADLTTHQVSVLATVMATDIFGIDTTQTESCGADQIINYTVKPVTSAALRTVSNPQVFVGYSPPETIAWDAANGYGVVGSVSNPVLNNTASDLAFTVNIPAWNANLQTSTQYKLTCLDPALNTYQINKTVTSVTADNTGASIPTTVTCGNGQIIEYTVQPLTLAGLKETSNLLDAGGYTTSNTLTWSAANGYTTVGSISTFALNAGKTDLTFRVTIGSWNANLQTSTQYKLTCMNADRSTYQINDALTSVTASNTGDLLNQTVSCGTAKIIGYTLQPMTLAGLKEIATPMAAGGYSTSGTATYVDPAP